MSTLAPVLRLVQPLLPQVLKVQIFPSPLRSSPKAKCAKKTYIGGGEEFDEIEPGVFTQPTSLTRQSITHAKNRSINTILKVQNRSSTACSQQVRKCTGRRRARVRTSTTLRRSPCAAGSCRGLHQGEVPALANLARRRCRPASFLEGVCTRETVQLTCEGKRQGWSVPAS